MKKNLLVLLVISYMSSSTAASDSSSIPAHVFKLLTFNIDTNIMRTEEGYARDSYPEWRVGVRMQKIKMALHQIIDEHSPDVIHLQEGRKFTTKFGDEVDSVTPLTDFLRAAGYQVSTEQYNPSDRAFLYITAIRPGYTIDKQAVFYLTKTPEKPTDHNLPIADIKDNNFGEEWERCTYITEFHDAQGRQYRTKNVHLGIGELHRKKACEMLREDTEQAIAHNPALLELTSGDFNSFPDWGGPAQLDIMAKDGVLQEATQKLLLPNGMQVKSTFIAYPYDFGADERRLNERTMKEQNVTLAALLTSLDPLTRKQKIGELFKEECKALGGHLDRVYQHGFSSSTATLIPTPQFDDFSSTAFDEMSIKEFIVSHYNDGAAFVSDHQPVLVTCMLPQ